MAGERHLTRSWPAYVHDLGGQVGQDRLVSFSSRVDVLFQNVKAMKLPTLPHGLVVAEADPEQVATISRETGLLPDREEVRVGTAGRHHLSVERGLSVAGIIRLDIIRLDIIRRPAWTAAPAGEC